MRILRWISEVMRKDRMRDEFVRGSIGEVSIRDKMRGKRLRWFGERKQKQ